MKERPSPIQNMYRTCSEHYPPPPRGAHQFQKNLMARPIHSKTERPCGNRPGAPPEKFAKCITFPTHPTTVDPTKLQGKLCLRRNGPRHRSRRCHGHHPVKRLQDSRATHTRIVRNARRTGAVAISGPVDSTGLRVWKRQIGPACNARAQEVMPD